MDKVNEVMNGFYEVLRILAKVFTLWNFTGDRIDFNYNRDIGESENPGELRALINDLFNAFK